MSNAQALATERRARLAAERMLVLKQNELFAANAELSKHALLLSDEIVEKREEVKVVRHVADELRGQNNRALQDLEVAHHAADTAERRLWDSVETVEDGFAVFDANNELVAANTAYLSVFEDPELVRPGQSYEEIAQIMVEEGIVDIGVLSPKDWLSEMLARWNGAALEPKTIKLWNGVFIKLVDRRSQNNDTVSMALNITDTIRREKLLESARTKAEAANRAKSAFLAKMSHELRTPMNSVVGMADLLAETVKDDEQKLFVETIKSSGESLLSLINDVLDYSKMEAGKLVLHAESFDLERVLRDVITLFQPSVMSKNIELILDYDMFLPSTIVGDKGRIRQIITNLIGNAVKFTESGDVLVKVVGQPEDDTDNYRIQFIVEDTGPGIPENMADHIFGEFNQVEDEKNRKFEGTGLGLAITRQLVKLMGGEIWLESEVGKGSVFGFYISLPAGAEGGFQLDQIPEWIGRIFVLSGPRRATKKMLEQLRVLGGDVVEMSLDAFRAAPTCKANDVLIIDLERVDSTVSEVIAAMQAHGVLVPVILTQKLRKNETAPSYDNIFVAKKPVGRKTLVELLNGIEPKMSKGDERTDIGQSTIKNETPVTIEIAPAEQASPERRMRILAAEDNKTNRLVFSKLVGKLNIDLEFAENGEEAVEKWQVFKPDLIFMDISMPKMDGKEATQRIREIEKETGAKRTTIVALTAHAMTGDDKDFLKAGLDQYLTKPLRKAKIFGQIEDAKPADGLPVFPDEIANAAE